jgi:hypothetical protein
MIRDSGAVKQRNSTHFLAPILAAVTGGAVCLSFLAGTYVSQEQKFKEDHIALAASSNPGDALEQAQKLLRDQEIDFDDYKKFLERAWNQPDAHTRERVAKSIAEVSNPQVFGPAIVNKLNEELKGMPLRVFIDTADDAGASVARVIEDHWAGGGAVVFHQTRDAKAIPRSEVVCYDKESVCAGPAKAIVDIVPTSFGVSNAVQGDGSGAVAKKTIQVFLAAQKSTVAVRQPDRPISHRPRQARPVDVAARTGGSSANPTCLNCGKLSISQSDIY